MLSLLRACTDDFPRPHVGAMTATDATPRASGWNPSDRTHQTGAFARCATIRRRPPLAGGQIERLGLTTPGGLPEDGSHDEAPIASAALKRPVAQAFISG